MIPRLAELGNWIGEETRVGIGFACETSIKDDKWGVGHMGLKFDQITGWTYKFWNH